MDLSPVPQAIISIATAIQIIYGTKMSVRPLSSLSSRPDYKLSRLNHVPETKTRRREPRTASKAQQHGDSESLRFQDSAPGECASTCWAAAQLDVASPTDAWLVCQGDIWPVPFCPTREENSQLCLTILHRVIAYLRWATSPAKHPSSSITT